MLSLFNEDNMEELLVLLLLKKKQGFVQKRPILRQLGDNSNPFETPNNLFVKMNRMPKEMYLELIQQLAPLDNQNSKIPFALRFLSTLYFFANGSFQSCVGANVDISLSQASVSRTIKYISELIVSKFQNEIAFPKTSQERVKLKTVYKITIY